MNNNIENYGYTDFYKEQIQAFMVSDKDLIPARITEVHKEQYKIVTEFGENNAKLKGSLFYNNEVSNTYSAIGDFVMVKQNPYGEDIIYQFRMKNHKIL